MILLLLFDLQIQQILMEMEPNYPLFTTRALKGHISTVKSSEDMSSTKGYSLLQMSNLETKPNLL